MPAASIWITLEIAEAECAWGRANAAFNLWLPFNRRIMKRVIPFYVPNNFKPKATIDAIPRRSAKVIEFRPSEVKKPA